MRLFPRLTGLEQKKEKDIEVEARLMNQITDLKLLKSKV